jgi:hypothetical protein
MKSQFGTDAGGRSGMSASIATEAGHSANGGVLSGFKIRKFLFRGPRIFVLAGLLIMSTVLALAADTPEASVAYRPGDTVRIFVAFKQPVSLKNAMLRFGLQGPLPAGQKVFTPIFDASSFAKLSDSEFELTGKIGEHVATGTYQLSFINATDDADFTRTFSGQDLPVVTISVRNDRRVEFPDIQSIRVAEHSTGRP